MTSQEPQLVRMSELARRSGVPAATIKHYLREGLLPPAAKRSGRTMAYYDLRSVERIRRIKSLQRRRYLPLRVIRDMLDKSDAEREHATQAALDRTLASMADDSDRRTRQELIDGGMPSEQLDFFRSLGLVTPEGEDETYSGDDLALLRTLGAARRAGLDPAMLPYTITGPYVTAIRQLARIELEMFRQGMRRKSAAEADELVDVATKLSEQLVVLIRRKMLSPMLRQLTSEARGEAHA